MGIQYCTFSKWLSWPQQSNFVVSAPIWIIFLLLWLGILIGIQNSILYFPQMTVLTTTVQFRRFWTDLNNFFLWLRHSIGIPNPIFELRFYECCHSCLYSFEVTRITIKCPSKYKFSHLRAFGIFPILSWVFKPRAMLATCIQSDGSLKVKKNWKIFFYNFPYGYLIST